LWWPWRNNIAWKGEKTTNERKQKQALGGKKIMKCLWAWVSSKAQMNIFLKFLAREEKKQ
jgi:hypothetical protein